MDRVEKCPVAKSVLTVAPASAWSLVRVRCRIRPQCMPGQHAHQMSARRMPMSRPDQPDRPETYVTIGTRLKRFGVAQVAGAAFRDGSAPSLVGGPHSPEFATFACTLLLKQVRPKLPKDESDCWRVSEDSRPRLASLPFVAHPEPPLFTQPVFPQV